MSRRQVLNLFFQSVPANHPPAVWIRQVDHALLAGLATFAALALGLGWIVWRPLFGSTVPDGGLISQLFGYPALVLSQLTHGHFFRHAVVDNPAVFSLFALHVRLFPVWLLSLSAGTAVFISALTPWRRMQHIEGPQLLDGKEAVAAAARETAKELNGQPPFMWLGPLPLPKTRWTRGLILYGSPGSGKTVVLHEVIRQLIEANHRSFIYDVKGDFTACYLGMNGTVGLVCPWDKRGCVWDIARDVRSPSAGAILAAALIPDAGGDGKFWSSAARQLFEGTLISLQNELGINWGWQTLADRLAVDSVVMAERMAKHSPMAELLVKDDKSSTTSSVLATLVGYTKMVQDLARAWSDGEDDAGNFRPSISFTAWAKDSYPGACRQILFQAGPDRAMTTALASAILNVLTPELLSAALPDDELGRTIALVLDEAPSLGPVPFQVWIERGRSKGLITILAVQTLEQIKSTWGDETMKSLGSMIGTHVVFRVQQSASRDTIAEQFGKARWSITGVTTGANGGSTSVHEENRAVVQPHELSELGPVKGKQFPLGWGIQAMVALGGDVLTLDFPGVSPPKRRTPHRPAKWTKGPAKPGQEPEPTPALRLMLAKTKAAADEAEMEAQKARNEETRAEVRKRNEQRRKANKKRVTKDPADIGDGPDFPFDAAKEPEQRDDAAWAAARTVPAAPQAEDPFEPEAASTARERILAGAKRSSPIVQSH